ncbi:MAG: DUF1003 domain-containing protein [Actinomycetales bacterium]
MADSPSGGRGNLDTPRELRRGLVPRPEVDAEMFGVWSERFARFMGTPRFLVYMSVFVAVWLIWNTWAPERFQFDPRSLNYTLLTLILSLQASYAAPLILLAQNRQDDRDRFSLEQDRQRAERNLADTEYLAREVAALRIAMREVATRDYLRSELRELLEDLTERGMLRPEQAPAGRHDRQSTATDRSADRRTISQSAAHPTHTHQSNANHDSDESEGHSHGDRMPNG